MSEAVKNGVRWRECDAGKLVEASMILGNRAYGVTVEAHMRQHGISFRRYWSIHHAAGAAVVLVVAPCLRSASGRT
jgi:hypothetical protein